MIADLLQRATEALRAQGGTPNPRSGLTRARILQSAEKQARVRRGAWLRWPLAFAGVFVVGTALARFGGELPLVRQALETIREVVPAMIGGEKRHAQKGHAAAANAATRPNASTVPTSEAAATTTTATTAATTTTPIATTEPTPSPRAGPNAGRKPKPHRSPSVTRAPVPPHPISASTAEAPGQPTPAAAAPEAAELALFRRADALQRARDPRALAAWDAYLRVAEHGVLAPEARYNRALCLIRQGRNAEARTALAPFARGEENGYRKHDAQALLLALPR